MQVLHVLQLTEDSLFLAGFCGAASMKYQSVARIGACQAAVRHRSHHFATQSSHSVDRAGWQVKMASIEFWIQ